MVPDSSNRLPVKLKSEGFVPLPTAWLKVHQDRAGNVASASCLVEVDLCVNGLHAT